jgi:hypothetical protein
MYFCSALSYCESLLLPGRSCTPDSLTISESRAGSVAPSTLRSGSASGMAKLVKPSENDNEPAAHRPQKKSNYEEQREANISRNKAAMEELAGKFKELIDDCNKGKVGKGKKKKDGRTETQDSVTDPM